MEKEQRPVRRSSSRTEFFILGGLCLIGTIFIFLVLQKNFIFGSVIGHWYYQYFKDETSILIWVPYAAILLIGGMVFFGTTLVQRYEKLVLLGSFILGICIEILLNSLYPFRLSDIINSTVATSFYTASQQYSPGELLRNFETLLPSLPLHARSNMPGKILFFHFLGLFTSNPRLLAYMIIGISTFGGLIIYAICKRLFQDKTIAYFAFLLYILIPGKLAFFPILNTVTPVFILFCLYMLILFIDKQRYIFLVLLGLSLYAMLIFEPSPLPTGMIFVAVLIHSFSKKKIAAKDLFTIVIIPAAAFFTLHLFMVLVFSFDIIGVFLYMLNDAIDYNGYLYWIWLFDNSKEFLYGMGVPVGLIFLWSVSKLFFGKNNPGKNLLQWPIEHLYTLALLLTYLFVLIIGINRGEITRLWIYLAVFFQVPAAVYLGRLKHYRIAFFFICLTIAMQSIIALQMVNFITP